MRKFDCSICDMTVKSSSGMHSHALRHYREYVDLEGERAEDYDEVRDLLKPIYEQYGGIESYKNSIENESIRNY